MPEPKGFLVVPVGFRADGTLRALELTDSDELKVALATATGSDLLTELQAKLETADLELVSKILSNGPHGWISGVWQRNPLSFGFSGQVERLWTDTNLSAGANTVDDSAVPAGEIWIITQLSIMYDGTAPDDIQFAIRTVAQQIELFEVKDPVPSIFYDRQGWWILVQGDKLRLSCSGATAGNDLLGRAMGFRVDIDQ